MNSEIWAQYTIKLKNQSERDSLQARLKESGIPSMVYYPKAMHTQKAFAGNKNYVDCSVTEKLCQTVLSLPMHPYMTEEEIGEVVKIVRLYI